MATPIPRFRLRTAVRAVAVLALAFCAWIEVIQAEPGRPGLTGNLSPVPADWGPSVSKYQYIYSDNHVYFVEPSSRKVVTVID